jgi:hypothetical protein
MGTGNLKKSFIVCEKCGKRLIERMPNGVFRFIFGKPGEGSSEAPVDLFIQGNVKIKCLRRNCGHWQILTYLPNVFQSSNLEDCSLIKKTTLKED